MEPTTRTSNSTGRRVHRRGDGEGSIHKRADGRWIGRLMVGYLADGQPDRRQVSAMTRAEVQQKLDAIRASVASGRLVDKDVGSTSVATFLDRWVNSIEGTVRPRTLERYAEVVRLHLSPTIGRHKLADLRPHHLQQLYADKRRGGLAPRTVQYIHATIRRALGMAVRWDSVPRNVALDVEAPRVPKREIHPPSPTDLAQLIDTSEANRDRLAVLWNLTIFTGARLGEMLGLQWQDVDLDTGAITIRRTLERVVGTLPTFAEPKSATSRRRISIPDEAVEGLRHHHVKQKEERLASAYYAEHDLVFCTHLGTPLGARNVGRDFKLALGRAGLPASIRFHDLRHAHATAMLAAGVHIKTASARLGHSQIAITLDLYSHALPELDAEAAIKAAGIVRRGTA
ncbi:MAG: site-specific integrase [Chloroflexi bacterium]|nr:site-specific integrase [Chloroflexota bacterium]